MKNVLDFVKKNWLTLELIVVNFFVSIEVLDTWAAWASIFLPFFVWAGIGFATPFKK